MRPSLVVVAAAGLLMGAAASSLIAGCGDCPAIIKLPSGTFVPPSGSGLEADYELVVASDFSTVKETFTRAGKSYAIDYKVVTKTEF